MALVGNILTGLVALEHVYILYLEMFLWAKPKGLKTFGLDREFAEKSKVLAMNQGLYNGFLAAGLLWALLHPDARVSAELKLFFLTCVLAAGIFGGLTAKRSILWVQGLPALAALLVVIMGSR